MNVRACLPLLLLLGPVDAARADGYLENLEHVRRPWLVEAGWEYAVPIADLRSRFIDARSAAGVNASLQYGFASGLSVGLDVGWNRFDQSFPTGDHVRLDALAARGTVHYYFARKAVEPYVAMGAGVVHREAVLNGGPTQSGWAPCLDPQIGVLFNTENGLAIDVGIHYGFTAASFNVNGDPAFPVSNPQWLALRIALGVYDWHGVGRRGP